jgi:hypothetical protein
MRQNETEKTDKKYGEHAAPCIKTTKAESWHYSPIKFSSQWNLSVKNDQAVSSYLSTSKQSLHVAK